MNILITGHKGLIGSRLLSHYEKQGNTVTGFDLGDTFPEDQKFDLIIHCASKCVVREVIADPTQMMDNIESTMLALNKARKDEAKIVLFSSNRVISGKNNPYISSKKFLEEVAIGYNKCYGVKSVIIRPETVWGENESFNRVIPRWISKAKNNEDIIVYGDENKELSPLHVIPFCEKVIDIIDNFEDNMDTMYEPISITGDIQKVTDIISIIKRVTNSTSEVIHAPAEMEQPQSCEDTNNTLRIEYDFAEAVENFVKNKF